MDMNALPEGCIANAISQMNPREICRLALVNSTFCSASQSDAVWERFLPSDYLDIIARSPPNLDEIRSFGIIARSTANLDVIRSFDIIAPSTANLDVIRSFSSKKELFLFLCDNQFLIDDGKKSIWLDKCSGKKCYMLAARDLHIVWGDTPQYWEWINLPGSRFQEVAKLRNVCWLEICGKITTDKLSPNTTYAAYLVFSTTSGFRGFDHSIAEASFGISGQDSGTLYVCFDPLAASCRGRKKTTESFATNRYLMCREQRASLTGQQQQHTTKLDANEQCPVQRDDCWMEVELGEFHVQGTQVVELKMGLKEVTYGNWKSGLIIEGIEIRPNRASNN